MICLILALVTVAAYWGVIGCDFVNFDDPDYLLENEVVKRGLSASGVIWAFTQSYAGNWHPLAWISHMLDCQLFGLEAGGHHLINLLFHAVNALLVFRLLHRLTGAQWRSAVVAGLFALHPLHVESVAWVSERKDVLSTFFGLLSLLAYARYAKKPKPESRSGFLGAALACRDRDYQLALVFFALGLLAKPMLVTLPFVMLLLDFWPLNRAGAFAFPGSNLSNRGEAGSGRIKLGGLLLEKSPLFLLSAASSGVTFFAQKAGGAIVTTASYPLLGRMANTPIAYCRYLGKMFWPVDLSIFYPYDRYRSIPLIIGAAVLLTIVSTASVMLVKRRPYALFGWLWFLGTLVPVIGLVQVGSQSMADRYTYLPLLGIFTAIVWASADFAASRGRAATLGAGTIAVLALFACGILTSRQVRYWKDSITLFGHAIAITKNNEVANNNLGVAYMSLKEPAKALAAYSEALRINPQSALFHNNVAMALSALGRYDRAFAHFEIAEKLDPKNVKFRNNFGNALVKAGSPEKALPHFYAAVRQETNYAEGYNGLGAALTDIGNLDGALTNILQALKIASNYAEAYNNLGRVLARQKKTADAIVQYNRALQIAPANASIHYNLGLALDKLKRTDEALRHFRQAVELDPHAADARYQLGRALFLRGEVGQSALHLSEVLQQKADHAQARLFLGLSYFELGRPRESITQLRQAGSSLPESVEALNAQAWVLATADDDAVRNGLEAVAFAERAAALSERKQPSVLHTLAAAYAAVDRFEDAVTTADSARELAQAQGQASLARALEDALNSYRSKRPLRHQVRLQ